MSCAEPDTPLAVAVMVVVPSATAVATPPPEIVATAWLLLLHWVDAVITLPFWSSTLAEKVADPFGVVIVVLGGVTATRVTRGVSSGLVPESVVVQAGTATNADIAINKVS